jgi:hypothetical protein
MVGHHHRNTIAVANAQFLQTTGGPGNQRLHLRVSPSLIP